MSKHAPTIGPLKVPGQTGDIETEKKKWIDNIVAYADFDPLFFHHPFFGKMIKE